MHVQGTTYRMCHDDAPTEEVPCEPGVIAEDDEDGSSIESNVRDMHCMSDTEGFLVAQSDWLCSGAIVSSI